LIVGEVDAAYAGGGGSWRYRVIGGSDVSD